MNKSLHILFISSLFTAISMAGGDITPVEPHIDISTNQENTHLDQAEYYTGIGYTRMRYDEINEEHSHRGLTLQAGYDFNPYIGIEARYTKSNADTFDTSYAFGGDLDNLAIYLKPMLPITTDVSLYALLGYGRTSIDTKTGEHSESDFQWGAGAKYHVTEYLSLFWDYTQIYKGNGFDRDADSYDVTLKSVNVGLNYLF